MEEFLDTSHRLANTLENLVKKKPFEDITVSDIINECGLSRTTFYRHFQDKYELMIWIYKNQVDEFIAKYNDISSWQDFILQVCYFIKSKQQYLSNIIPYKHQNSFQDFYYDYCVNYCIMHITKASGKQILDHEVLYSIKMYCAGCLQVTYEWLKVDCKESPEFISKIHSETMPLILREYFF